MNYGQPPLTNSNYILILCYNLTKTVLYFSCKNVGKKTCYSHDQLYFVLTPDPNARLSLLTQPDWCYHMVNMPFNVYIPTLVLL